MTGFSWSYTLVWLNQTSGSFYTECGFFFSAGHRTWFDCKTKLGKIKLNKGKTLSLHAFVSKCKLMLKTLVCLQKHLTFSPSLISVWGLFHEGVIPQRVWGTKVWWCGEKKEVNFQQWQRLGRVKVWGMEKYCAWDKCCQTQVLQPWLIRTWTSKSLCFHSLIFYLMLE